MEQDLRYGVVMKSYKHINLYPSDIFPTGYRLVLSEKVYLWIVLDQDYIEAETLRPVVIPVLKNPLFLILDKS